MTTATTPAGTTTADVVGAAIPAPQGGWVDECELADLLDRAVEFGRADLGRLTNVMDAGTLVLSVAAHDGRPAVSISVYALGMGDDDNSDLTEDQEKARRGLSAWLTAVKGALHLTGPIPLERILLYETRDSIPMISNEPGRPVPWTGEAPDPQPPDYGKVGCQLLTGTAAADAVANAERSSAANGYPERRLNSFWGAFTVNGSERYFALVAAAPGQDCR
ncbi:hypothetical protein [Nakamurella lactea]|uniref:hypothetical protein n=1 Tax=Nakamurella lactea TaxID=459515 RepID=UPI000428F435|nr:hypothetical protein [Nakamurella lactea]